jgi:DNA-binding beta-propeller fold protein YncE
MPTATGTRLLPRYELDERWSLKLPEGRYLGSVTGVQVTPDGHVWVLHIASIMEWGPEEGTKDPAARLPAVCEFDAEGKFVRGWGGPDWLPREDGLQQWPKQEETIAFDDEGMVWVFGANTEYDHAVQRFTPEGKLLLRIGKYGEKGTDDTPDRLGCPTDAWHDVVRREVYVTDGYTNHRVAVFNSDTGAFLRSWGAFGEVARAAGSNPRATFNNPVHAISLGPEGHLYVCDRKNDRVQAFDAVGRETPAFVREIELNRPSPFGTCFNLAFTPDGRFMVINDGNNSNLDVVDLETWTLVDHFRPPCSDGVGLEGTVHKITTDAAGNLVLARTSIGIIRLTYEGNGPDGKETRARHVP